MTQQTQSLTKTGPLGLELPEHLKNAPNGALGFEDAGSEDMIIPRLSLAQALTPQLKKSHEQYNPDLRAGQFFNSLTGQVYGESVDLVPLFFYKQFIKWFPLDSGGGIDRMYANRQEVPDAELGWGADNEKPATTVYLNFMSLLPDFGSELIVASFSKTASAAGKRIVSFGKMLNKPAYARVYRLTAVDKVKGAFNWSLVKVEPRSFTSPEFYSAAEAYFSSLRKGGYKVDTTGLQDEEGTGDTQPADAERESTPF